jgi:ketosteroid isomerase-like protein
LVQGSVEDRLALRELIEAYAAATTRFDVDAWGQCWAEDSAWQLSSMTEPVRGKDVILATFRERTEYAACISLLGFPAEIVVEGDRAKGKTYTRELVYPKAGGRIEVVGCFHDEYVRQNGRWYFAVRIYEAIRKESQPA